MTVKQLLKQWLELNKFDGLFLAGECSCTNEDLIMCDADFSDCEPGYKMPCDCGEGCTFHIGIPDDKQSAMASCTSSSALRPQLIFLPISIERNLPCFVTNCDDTGYIEITPDGKQHNSIVMCKAHASRFFGPENER